MSIDSFQRFVENFCPNAFVPVDLIKIAKNVLISNVPTPDQILKHSSSEVLNKTLCLVLDGECCLERLYGGYFGDWVCGGQWNRMFGFLRTFFQITRKNNIEITVCLNGSLEPERMRNWIEKQDCTKVKVYQILRHTLSKGTPPPKVWWVAPNGLRSCLRMLLRQLNVKVVMTSTDHHLEVITFMKNNCQHGLLADDPVYLIFDPPRYFSSVQLKLTYKGCIETKECILSEVTKSLDLHPSRIYLVATLLGNHILCIEDLTSFHKSLCSGMNEKIESTTIIKAVVDYVRSLPSVDDLTEVAAKVFGSSSDNRCEKFKQSVFYYCRGYQRDEHCASQEELVSSIDADLNSNLVKDQENSSTSSKQEFASDSHYNLEVSSAVSKDQELDVEELDGDECSTISEESSSTVSSFNFKSIETNLNSSTKQEDSFQVPVVKPSDTSNKIIKEHVSSDAPTLPSVSPDVLKMSLERHRKGLMHPFIHQILSHGEVKIPVILEDDYGKELPLSSELYKPLRQMVYAILFNYHHLKFLSEQRKAENGIAEPVPEIIIKEWVMSKSNKCKKPDLVPALPLGCSVPTVSRLWFHSGPEVQTKRMRAFLTCMRSNSPLMFDSLCVPQHMILLCCVLRYLIASPEMPFLHKYELDAFLAQAVDPQIKNPDYVQKLEIPAITPRGVMLGAIFMQGVDLALMANDACGAPISWLMCSPWLFFDGKLFHYKLLKANSSKNLTDLCDNKFEEVALVEQMRTAIVEGLSVKYLPSSFHPPSRPVHSTNPSFSTYTSSQPHMPFQDPHPIGRGIGRGLQRVVPSGGKLEVAGVVVGSWGANYGQGPKSYKSMPPKVFSVGNVGCGKKTVNKHNQGESSSLSKKNPLASKTTICLGLGRGAPSTDDSEKNELGFRL